MSDFPTGTITFLFTDVEASTPLWESSPAAMAVAIERHDALLTACIEEHRGAIVRSRGEGDSFFSVFAQATEAVAAACAIQRAVLAEPWPTPAPLLVRIGLHTGEAQFRDSDYYGVHVNRASRLRTLAHGGQIVVSEVTAGLVRDLYPDEVSLRDLGHHRLRGLTRPERVYQVVHPALPSE